MTMRDTINAAFKDAMKSQDKRRVATLRLINAAIKDRDIAARSTSDGGVGDAEILEILAKMIKQRRESVQTYEEAGRVELAEQEREEITIIEEFLPQQLSEGEMSAAVDATLAKLECQGLKDMGPCHGGPEGELRRADGFRQGERPREAAPQQLNSNPVKAVRAGGTGRATRAEINRFRVRGPAILLPLSHGACAAHARAESDHSRSNPTNPTQAARCATHLDFWTRSARACLSAPSSRARSN